MDGYWRNSRNDLSLNFIYRKIFHINDIFIIKLTTMACSKYNLVNTGTTIAYFSYRKCDDSAWQYQVKLETNQTKNIWLLNNTYSTAFSDSIALTDLGAFTETN